MDSFEKAKYIDKFLKSIYDASLPISFAEGIESKQLPSQENIEKFITLEFIIEELGLVQLINGRNNSTLNGQCEYKINGKGRQLVENNESSLTLLLAKEFKNSNSEFYDEKRWDDYINEKINKRVSDADFFLELLVSENIVDIDKTTLKNHFKKWFKEKKEFDLQIKNGDLAIEDGSFQMIPTFEKNDIPDFVKCIDGEKEDFLKYLKNNGVESKKSEIQKDIKHKESNWTKVSVITAIIALIVSIIIGLWENLK